MSQTEQFSKSAKVNIDSANLLQLSNGSNADKAPFMDLPTVQPATRLPSSLCAINQR
jgi:hypothetical protein